MTKQAFLDRLDELMAHLPESERERLRTYFGEMIDDRVELGMDEAAAVAALGAPEDLLKDVSPAVPAVPVPRGGNDEGCEGEIREIYIHLKNADATLLRQALPGNMSAQLRASEPNRFTWNLSGGVLTVSERDEVRRGLFRRDAKLTLALSGFTPAKLVADSYGGDIDLSGVEIADMAVLSSSSGDIRITRARCGGRMEVTSRSGDLRLEETDVAGDCKLESMSGDVELRRLKAGSFRVRTASGDTDCAGLRAHTAAIGAVSGDIEVSDALADISLLCESTSGDVDLRRAIAPDTRLSSISGDIKAAVSTAGGSVSAMADTKCGDIRIDFAESEDARYRIVARSVSGDISIVEA